MIIRIMRDAGLESFAVCAGVRRTAMATLAAVAALAAVSAAQGPGLDPALLPRPPIHCVPT